MSRGSDFEASAEREEIAELRELVRAQQILSALEKKPPNESVPSINEAIRLIDDAHKHNDRVAERSQRVLQLLAEYAKRKFEDTITTEEEDTIIRNTLAINPHLISIKAHLNYLLHLAQQAAIPQISVPQRKIVGAYKFSLSITLEDIKKLINTIRDLIRLEDDVRKRMSKI